MVGITNNIFGVYILNLKNQNLARFHVYIYLLEVRSLISCVSLVLMACKLIYKSFGDEKEYCP